MSVAHVARRGDFAKPGAGAAFDPSTVPGLQAWYDASAITGLSDGAAVASWSDRSGNSRTLTQATGGAQPLYKANILNGLPVVRMDGSNDYLSYTVPGADMISGPLFTVFAVWKNVTDASAFAAVMSLVSGGAPTDYGSSGCAVIGSNDGSSPSAGTNDYRANTTLSSKSGTQGLTVHQTTHLWDGTNNTLRYDGTAQTPVASAGDLFGHTIYVGCRYTGSPSNFNTKDYAEMLIYSTAVSGANVLSIEAYLKAKWGTP